ncbi:MAG TPA: glycoside hydrolase, partial [Myxococcales bacterium]
DKALAMTVRPGAAPCPIRDESGAEVGSGRCGALVELSLSLTALGLLPADHLRMVLRLLRAGVEVDRFPRYGELEMVVPDRSFERTHWHV